MGWRLAALALLDAERLMDSADAAAALDLEAFGANFDALNELAESRRYPGIKQAFSNLSRLLVGSSLWEPGLARNLQDPLIFWCILHVHGAARDRGGASARPPTGSAAGSRHPAVTPEGA